MDLETNESAYMPQAAHSSRPQTRSDLSPQLTRSASRQGDERGQCTSLPSTLAGLTQHRRLETDVAPVRVVEPLGTEATIINASTSTREDASEPDVDSGEVAPGWYDQVEMLLATAETRYLQWREELELQGSVTEEELRREEEARVERRYQVVVELKNWRRATVATTLHEAVEGDAKSAANESEIVDIDSMMQKLGTVVDESAKQLAAMRQAAPWKRLAENLPHEERDYVSKGADEMFLEKMKYKRDTNETNAIIQHHLQALFHKQTPTKNGQSFGRIMTHSLGQMLREFTDIFHAAYGDRVLLDALATRSHHGAVATRLLPLVAADVNHFALIVVQVLHFKYPELPHSSSISVVHRVVIDALFDHLQPTLHALYAAAFLRENDFLAALTQRLRAGRLEQFGIRPAFRLDGSWPSRHGMRDTNELYLQSLRSYEPVIHKMNSIFTHRSPWVKAELLASVCRDLDTLVKDFHRRKAAPSPPEEDINMAADDLAAVLSFVLASAPTACGHIATQLAILGSYLSSDSALGEDCFAVATLWTAVCHLCHLT